MTKTLDATEAQVHAKHKDSMMLSLQHRLEVAKAANNWQLIQLLEREQREIAPETHANPLQALATGLKEFTQELLHSVAGGSELQVQQIEAGGDRWWYAYDPRTGESVYADTDRELMRWINANYQGK